MFFEGTNFGAVRTVSVIELKNVAFPQFQETIRFDEIFTQNGKDFEEISHIFETAGFLEEFTMDNAGGKYAKEVVLIIPKLRPEVSELVGRYIRRKLALLITDMNGQQHLVSPVRIDERRKIPALVAGLNGTDLRFSGESEWQSPLVGGEDVSP